MTALDFTAAGSAHPPRATQYRAAGALAYLRRQTKRRRADDAEGHLLYLLRTGVVVVPEHRLDGAWSCIPIADPTRPPACDNSSPDSATPDYSNPPVPASATGGAATR